MFQNWNTQTNPSKKTNAALIRGRGGHPRAKDQKKAFTALIIAKEDYSTAEFVHFQMVLEMAKKS